MDNQELLTQIAQMMEDQTRSLREEMSSMEERMDQKMSSMEDRIGQKIDQAIAKNNVAIAELVNEALEPVARDIREIGRRRPAPGRQRQKHPGHRPAETGEVVCGSTGDKLSATKKTRSLRQQGTDSDEG